MDLLIAAYVLILAALLAYRASNRVGSLHPILSQYLIAIAIFFTLGVAWGIQPSLRWAKWIPHSSVVLFANGFALAYVASAGLLCGSRCLSTNRCRILAGGLCMAAMTSSGWILLRPCWKPIHLSSNTQWKDGVCLQSHESSCSAAAAVTLLDRFGLPATERTLASTSLTNALGTTPLGTYRGLCLATRGTNYKPIAIANPRQTSEMIQVVDKLPMLAHVQFDDRADSRVSVVYRGLRRSEGHAVVILKRNSDGSWLVADPAVGKVLWSEDFMNDVWTGEGIYLSQR